MAQPDPANVARWFRFLLLAILAVIAVNVGSFIPDLRTPPVWYAFIAVAFAVQVTVVVLLVGTTLAMGWSIPSVVISAIGVFLPLINLIVLFNVNQKAVAILKGAGYRVGLFGAKA